MTSAYIDAYKSFLMECGNKEPQNKIIKSVFDSMYEPPPKMINGANNLDNSKTISVANDLGNIPDVNNVTEILEPFENKSAHFHSVKMEVNYNSVQEEYLLPDQRKMETDRDGSYCVGNSEDKNPESEDTVIASSADYEVALHSEDGDSFIPIDSQEGMIHGCDESMQTSYLQNAAAKPSPRKRCKSRYKGPVTYGRRKRRRRRFMRSSFQKPRVIVEMSPAHAIPYSEISAFKDSDVESEGDNNSDNDSKSVGPSLSSLGGITIKTEPPEVLRGEPFDQDEDAVLIITPPACASHHDSSDIYASETAEEDTAIPEEDEALMEDANISEIKKLFVPEQDSEVYLEIGEQIEEVCDDSLSSMTSLDPSKNAEVPLSSDTEVFTPDAGSSDECNMENGIPLQSVPDYPCTEDVLCTKSSDCKETGSPTVSPRKLRKNHAELNFEVKPGKGMKLGDIKSIAEEVMEAPALSISSLHFLLFNIEITVDDEQVIDQARKNILNFSGYQYSSENSCGFIMKKVRLKRMPSHIVSDIARILFSKKTVIRRRDQVETILSFLLCPTDGTSAEGSKKKKRKIDEDDEFLRMKEAILSGNAPVPAIILKKLSEEEIQKYSPKHVKRKRLAYVETPMAFNAPIEGFPIVEFAEPPPEYLNELVGISAKIKSYGCNEGHDFKLPSISHSEMEKLCADEAAPTTATAELPFIKRGCGKALKLFPEVVTQVLTAEDATIKLLHTFLYGFCDTPERCRCNVLEFTGFPDCQWHLVPDRKKFLELIPASALKKLCDVLCVCFNEANTVATIDILLKHLADPSEKLMQEKDFESQSALLNKHNSKSLGSYETIRFNIECASPDDLTELHDVLFAKPCDSFEVHQRVLDFSGFSFNTNSDEYYCRKTIMCYINHNRLKKVAELLDLKDFSPLAHKDEISSCILKFLMDLKGEVPENSNANNSKTDNSKSRTPSGSSKSPIGNSKSPIGNSKSSICNSKSPSGNRKNSSGTCTSSSGSSASPSGNSSSSSGNSAVCNNSSSTKAHIVMLRTPVACASNPSIVSFTRTNSPAPPKLIPVSSFTSSPDPRFAAAVPTREHSVPVQNSCQKANGESLFLQPKMPNEARILSEDYLSSSEDELEATLPLSAFVSHPSDGKLKKDIQEIIHSRLNTITISGLVNSIFSKYPEYDLRYRTKFIKCKARKILSQIQKTTPLKQNNIDATNIHVLPIVTHNEHHLTQGDLVAFPNNRQ